MPTFTDRELDIMTVLWTHGPATAAEVRDILAGEAGLELAYNTVLTMLRILEDKGHVGHAVEGRAHRFRPLVAREAASRSAVRRLVDGLFDRSPELLLAQLVRDERIDRATLERLRDVVETELAAGPAKAAPPKRGTPRRPR
ncbi:MAG: BlaI/MecI/CopY family transcriptional regulator [Gemmatimonadaceae bacterium]|jgi:predicted transcriptional regulator|nr:BlaI/MecI/CopY family transcriptional regulator [Gemmatimonadaceae bacterium]